jgi:hypothetical protein
MKLTTLFFAASLATAVAQPIPPQGGNDPRQQQDGPHHGPPPGGGHRPPPPLPIIGAIDADHNGVISSEEMQNAPQALQQLDRNGDGQLTPDEFAMPPRDSQGRQNRSSQSQSQQQQRGGQTGSESPQE